MMYFLLILFFASLLSIIMMLGRKLVLLKKEGIPIEEKSILEVLHLEKVKHFTIRNTRKYGHASIVILLTLYIRGINFLRKKYEEIKIKIKSIRKVEHKNGEKKETSKFLKIIVNYKNKIREIKHQIKNEENL